MATSKKPTAMWLSVLPTIVVGPHAAWIVVAATAAPTTAAAQQPDHYCPKDSAEQQEPDDLDRHSEVLKDDGGASQPRDGQKQAFHRQPAPVAACADMLPLHCFWAYSIVR